MKKYRLIKDVPGIKAGEIVSEYSVFNFTFFDLDREGLLEVVDEIWTPKEGEKYYFIVFPFEVSYDIKSQATQHKDRIKNGNCFRTKEQCERARELVKEALNKAHEEFGE